MTLKEREIEFLTRKGYTPEEIERVLESRPLPQVIRVTRGNETVEFRGNVFGNVALLHDPPMPPRRTCRLSEAADRRDAQWQDGILIDRESAGRVPETAETEGGAE